MSFLIVFQSRKWNRAFVVIIRGIVLCVEMVWSRLSNEGVCHVKVILIVRTKQSLTIHYISKMIPYIYITFREQFRKFVELVHNRSWWYGMMDVKILRSRDDKWLLTRFFAIGHLTPTIIRRRKIEKKRDGIHVISIIIIIYDRFEVFRTM